MRQTKSALAPKRVYWPLHPCRLGGPQRFNAGDKIEKGPQMGGLATSPLQAGVPNAGKQGTKSEVAHKWAV